MLKHINKHSVLVLFSHKCQNICFLADICNSIHLKLLSKRPKLNSLVLLIILLRVRERNSYSLTFTQLCLLPFSTIKSAARWVGCWGFVTSNSVQEAVTRRHAHSAPSFGHWCTRHPFIGVWIKTFNRLQTRRAISSSNRIQSETEKYGWIEYCKWIRISNIIQVPDIFHVFHPTLRLCILLIKYSFSAV